MMPIECLAHRGWWNKPRERNTMAAFRRALEAGYGIETDVRDQNGKLVISHDPPVGELPTLDDLLRLYREVNATGTLAINIKSDGLQNAIERAIEDFKIENYFVFDMAVPDSLAYLRRGVRCFRRASELEPLEPVAPTLAASDGIWLDAFFSIWYSSDTVAEMLCAGRDVCIVSPELHGRDHESLWEQLRNLSLTGGEKNEPAGKLMLCTDLPDRFEQT